MRVVKALAVAIGVAMASTVIMVSSAAQAKPWWDRVINEQRCSEGKLKWCGKDKAPQPVVNAPKSPKKGTR